MRWGAPPLRIDCTASGGGEKELGGFSCGILHLGAEGVFVEANDWRMAGGIVDGEDVETAGAFADAAFGEEMPSCACQEFLLALSDA